MKERTKETLSNLIGLALVMVVCMSLMVLIGVAIRMAMGQYPEGGIKCLVLSQCGSGD